MQRLHQAHPNVRFELSALSSEQILEQLASNRLDIGVSYLERLDSERFESLALGETRMGLLYDQRFFSFGEQPLSWEAVIELPLGMLTSGMHFRQSIDHNFHSRGLTPQPLLQTDAVHQLLQAVHGGLCCAIMPLDGGLEALTEHLRLQPIADANTLAHLPDHAPQRTALGPGRGVLRPAAEITQRVLIDGIYRHISTSN